VGEVSRPCRPGELRGAPLVELAVKADEVAEQRLLRDAVALQGLGNILPVR
jgi:hypothetical protein